MLRTQFELTNGRPYRWYSLGISFFKLLNNSHKTTKQYTTRAGSHTKKVTNAANAILCLKSKGQSHIDL